MFTPSDDERDARDDTFKGAKFSTDRIPACMVGAGDLIHVCGHWHEVVLTNPAYDKIAIHLRGILKPLMVSPDQLIQVETLRLDL